MGNKTDEYYVKKICDDLAFIIRYTKDINIHDLGSDELLLDSMMFRLIQISENAGKMSESFKSVNKDIPWTAISGLRNRIVHDYGHVDLGSVSDTIKNDIPNLQTMFQEDIKYPHNLTS